MDILTVNGPLSDQARSEALFQGKLLVFKSIPAMQQLIDYSDALLRQHLDGLTPPEAQHQLSPERFVDSTTEVQRIFRTSEEPKRLFFQAYRTVRRRPLPELLRPLPDAGSTL